MAGDAEVVLGDASSSLQNNLELLFVVEGVFGVDLFDGDLAGFPEDLFELLAGFVRIGSAVRVEVFHHLLHRSAEDGVFGDPFWYRSQIFCRLGVWGQSSS